MYNLTGFTFCRLVYNSHTIHPPHHTRKTPCSYHYLDSLSGDITFSNQFPHVNVITVATLFLSLSNPGRRYLSKLDGSLVTGRNCCCSQGTTDPTAAGDEIIDLDDGDASLDGGKAPL